MAIPGYKILRKVNEGGMSTVYMAIQLSVGREVALKIMSPALSADPDYSNLFYKEANIVGTLSHPNIVSVYDVGNHEGYNYIAMDYLPGASFKERISSGLSISEALRITKEIASALDHMHERGYVHLDLKPDNILFRSDGSAVLLDFGIAMTLSAAEKGNNSGAVAGTPQYMSPEQAQGRALDGRSDLYSLGILFYEMLTGDPPYKGPDAVQVAVKHMTAPLPSLPVQYKMFQPILNRMLAKKPEDRFRRGHDIIQAINALEGGLVGREQLTLEPTEPTALQAFSLVQALLAALGAVLMLLFKRFLGRFEALTRIRFSPRHGLVLKQKPPDPLAIMGTLEASEATADSADQATQVFGDDLSSALAHHQAKRLAPAPIIYGAGTLLLVALIGGGWWLFQPGTPTPTDTATPPAAQHTARPREPEQAVTAEPPADDNVASGDEPGLPAKPVRYGVAISVEPADASITFKDNGRPYDPAMQLPPGEYTIVAARDGYRSVTRTIEVTDSENRFAIQLQPRERTYTVGETFSDSLPGGATGPEMVVLPAGQFTMGDNSLDNARPAHTVTLSRPFAIGRYEVTWGQFKTYLEQASLPTPSGIGGETDSHPVTGVNWEDARAYAFWLSQQTGHAYRLPTEAEWEYAARAGTDTPYWWGDDARDMANCRRGCTTTWTNTTLFNSTPVGRYEANGFGLYDTAGNAAEWVQDCYHSDYSNAPADGRAVQPPEGQGCNHRVIRGGSYNDSATELQSAARTRGFYQARKSEAGFRVAMDLKPSSPSD